MRLLQVVLLATLVGCGGVRIETAPAFPAVPLPSDHVVRVMNSYAFASACAVGPYVFTAAHVLKPFDETPFLHDMMVGYAWSDPSGLSGLFDPMNASAYRDIAILVPTGGDLPIYQTVAKVPPQVGDTVRWIEYSREGEDVAYEDYFAPVERFASVTRLVAGHIAFDDSPTAGASGSCLFDSSGDVVGVVVWGMPKTGVAVLLTGTWGFE